MPVDVITTKGTIGPARNSDPAEGAQSVTPSDANDIWGNAVTVNSKPSRGLYVGVAGNITMTMADGTKVTRKNVPVGEWSWRVRQIWATGTDQSAGDIIADY